LGFLVGGALCAAFLDAMIKSGVPTSIVGGAGHFCGTNSVIDLLQKKGYEIEQL
jgi:uncharacterized protein YbaP (TraB family)